MSKINNDNPESSGIAKTLPGIELLFGILTSVIALWYVILIRIFDVSLENPASYSLMALGIAHYLVFIIISISSLILWIKTISFVSTRNINQSVQNFAFEASSFVLRWWLPIALIAITTLAISFILEYSENPSIILYISVFFILSILLGAAYIIHGSLREFSDQEHTGVFFVLFILCMPYITGMSIIFSDVNIFTDKQFYDFEDTIKISVKPNGYIFNPSIRNVYFNFDNSRPLYHNQTEISFSLMEYHSGNSYSNYLSVEFEPQIFDYLKRKDFSIRIAPPKAVSTKTRKE
ncbi:MAG: hypothetical protein EPO24_03710 [Bacteroidetes bacterium]|nr:MAG: hypothetical protein EPO24_03710 [Bacteroidota bacterium]